MPPEPPATGRPSERTPDGGRSTTGAATDGGSSEAGEDRATGDDGFRRRRAGLVAVVGVVTLLGVVARFVGLGDRPFHWDEARTGYWSLRFAATGAFEYRPVAGGPFLYVVNRWLFALAGPSDATARLAVAVIGGFLPLVSLSFRRRLGGTATVALAAFLAFDPLLVYYSRFLRGEIPLVAFSILAVAAATHALGDGSRRAALVAAAAGALALTTSGFAVVTVVCLAVAGVLVLDHRRLLAGARDRSARLATDGGETPPDDDPDSDDSERVDTTAPDRTPPPGERDKNDAGVSDGAADSGGPNVNTDAATNPDSDSDSDPARDASSEGGQPDGATAARESPATSGAGSDHITGWHPIKSGTVGGGGSDAGTAPTPSDVRGALERLGTTTLARAFLLAAVVLLAFFAPRAGAGGGPGLFRPTTFPSVLEAAFAGSARKFLGVHVVRRSQVGATHELLPFVADYAGTMVSASLPVVAFALVGFLVDRYGRGGPTPVVAFHAYWGFATLLFVPVAAEVSAPWLAVMGVVPLTVPAAVGVASVVGFGRRAWRRGDAATVAAVGLVVLSAGGHAGVVAAEDVYTPPSADSRVTQYAQPQNLDAVLANVSAATAAADSGATDVVYVGGDFSRAPSLDARSPPVSPLWGARLPLEWYFEREGLTRTAVLSEDGLEEMARPPPVVVATDSASRSAETALASTGTLYRKHRIDLALWDRTVVVYTRADTG